MKLRIPPHYTSISLSNFRGFKKSDRIPLAPLTFLVGPNSSGKSSIYDALLLLTQSQVLLTDEPPLVPTWIGSLVDLGNFEDTVFSHNPSLAIRLQVELSLASDSRQRNFLESSRTPITFDFEIRASNDDPVGNFRSITITDNLSSERLSMYFRPGSRPTLKQTFLGRSEEKILDRQLFGIGYPFADAAAKIERTFTVRRRTKKSKRARVKRNAWRRIAAYMRTSESFQTFIEGTQRVSSGRAAPRRWFSTTAPEELLPNSARRIFNGVYPAMVEAQPKTLVTGYTPVAQANRRTELNKALKQLNIANTVTASHLSPYHSAIEVKDSVTKITSNLIDVGYGASQVIPVITACLSNTLGPLFVEQPEIHLHPKAQGTLAELLCKTSLQRQVLIETHSAHMINRARLEVAKGNIDHRNVVIVYVDRDERGSHIYPIPLAASGDFVVDWPGGFFDERYEETMALLRLKAHE